MHHELIKFKCVVDEGSFTGAAERLHISQPALSMSVRHLEKTYGTQLIIREHGSLHLTRAGKDVYLTAARMQREHDDLLWRLRADSLDVHKQLRLGAIDSMAQCVLGADTLFESQELRVTVGPSRRLLDDVVQDRLDVAFITSSDEQFDGQVSFKSLGNEPLVLVGTSRPAKKLSPFYAYTEESNTYMIIQRALRSDGHTTQPTLFSSDPTVLLTMLLRAGGFAVLPHRMVRAEVDAGVISMYGAVIDRPIYAIWHNQRLHPEQLSSILAATHRLLTQEYDHATKAAIAN